MVQRLDTLPPMSCGPQSPLQLFVQLRILARRETDVRRHDFTSRQYSIVRLCPTRKRGIRPNAESLRNNKFVTFTLFEYKITALQI